MRDTSLRPNLIALLIAIVLISSSASAESKVTITPQVGVNGSFLTSELAGVTFSSAAGYQLGLNIRFGGFFHLQQGLYWQYSQNTLTLTANNLEGEVSTDQIHVPILFGLTIIPLKALDLRINAGASMNFLVNVQDNLFGLTKDHLKTFAMGLMVGVGLDFLFISTDLSYEVGLTDVFEADVMNGIVSSKRNVLRFSAGVRF
jgi:hypothetical protein